MTPSELKSAAAELYGQYGWQTKLAAALEVNTSTIRRWISGAIPIPNPVDAAMQCFICRKRASK